MLRTQPTVETCDARFDKAEIRWEDPFQRAPERKIHKIPSKIDQDSIQGRPRASFLFPRGGGRGSITIRLVICELHAPFDSYSLKDFIWQRPPKPTYREVGCGDSRN